MQKFYHEQKIIQTNANRLPLAAFLNNDLHYKLFAWKWLCDDAERHHDHRLKLICTSNLENAQEMIQLEFNFYIFMCWWMKYFSLLHLIQTPNGVHIDSVYLLYYLQNYLKIWTHDGSTFLRHEVFSKVVGCV